MGQIRAASRPMISLDQSIFDDDATLSDTLINIEDLDPEQGFISDELSLEVSDALELLTPREREIVMRYYGLGDLETSSLEAIGQDINLSRERVRQIRNQALKKIRQAVNGGKLVDFLT